MIFPSYVFLLAFMPLVLAWWLSSLPFRARVVGLTVASYVFYGWWDYRFTALMALSTLIDYYCGKRAADRVRGRPYVVASVLANLGLLGVFKYFDFFTASANAAFEAVGWNVHAPLLGIVLPIGISFYTFQSMSYTIDIYRGHAKPAPDFMHFAAYVSLFPQLVAGPIVRYRDMAEQLAHLRNKRTTDSEYARGCWYFLAGMCKKVLIADTLAPYAERLFDSTEAMTAGAAWLGTLAYTLQLYFDFSGYSDMAVGLGLVLGFRFPINFNSPYKARNIAEFWNRWHISLSHFLRDYLFIPLGGSRGVVRKTLRNLAITMALGGLWHGAQWTFVVWGLYHGVLLMTHAAARHRGVPPLPRVVAVALTFLAVHLGWVVFRAPDFARAVDIYAALFGFGAGDGAVYGSVFGALPVWLRDFGGLRVVAYVSVGLGVAFFASNTHEIKKWSHPVWAFSLGLAFAVAFFMLREETPFLYFAF